MSPSKPIAIALTALIALSAMPADAQSTDPNLRVEGVDLVVVKVDPAFAVKDVLSPLNVTIQNMGKQRFAGQGWQLVIGHTEAQRCIFPGSVPQSTPCYQRFPVNDTRMNSIDSGDSRTITLSWTPNVNHVGNGALVFSIQPFGADCWGSSASLTCQRDDNGNIGPSGETPANWANNEKAFTYFVRDPGVQAVPDWARPKTPTTATVNDPWAFDDITADCPTEQDKPAQSACKAQPGSLVTFKYRLQNLGNWQDTFEPSIRESTAGPNSLAARGYTYNFTPRLVTLEPNQARDVLLQVYVPATEKANNQTNVNQTTATVRWTSRTNPAVNTDDPPRCDGQATPRLCQDPSFPSLLVGIKRGMNATTLEPYRMSNVTAKDEYEKITYNITLNHTGNYEDIYTVVVENETSQINAFWSPKFTPLPPVRVEPFKNTTVTLELSPPVNATKGIHNIQITTQSAFDADAKTRRTLSFVAELQQRYNITGEGRSVVHALPAAKAVFPMQIRNWGNGPDNVSLTLANTPAGWTAQLSHTVIQIPPDSVATVYLNVTAPPNTPEGALAAFFVNATSQGPPEKGIDQRPSARFRADLRVLGGPNLEVAAREKSAFIDPGATHEYELTIRNTGNQRSNFTINAERPQDQLAWIVGFTPPDMILDPLQSGTVRVSLRAPTSGVVGETSKVFITVASRLDPAVFNQTTLEGQVSGPDLFVEGILVNSTNPYTGDPLELNVVAGNSGNKEPPTNATLKVYFVQGGVPRLIAERDYASDELGAGRRFSERIVWDTTGIEGSGVILARFDEDGLVAEIDDSPADNDASKAVTLRLFDIRIVPAQGLSGIPGELVSYSEAPNVFIVEYRGNQPTEPVEIFVESDHGWGSTRSSLALPRGTPLPVLVDVQIPEMPGVAEDALRISVVPTLRPGAVVTATTTTTVKDDTLPTLLGVGASPSVVKLGEPITLRADVVDATGLTSVRAFVVTPANETTTILLQRSNENAWVQTQTFPLAGVYRLYVEAIDGSANRNANSSRDTVVTFTVSPGSAPTIKLADGQPTTVRPGGFVRLNITDPLGVATAEYSLRNITYPLARPFQIDTSSFQAGAYELVVKARNIYGVESTARFTITVDDTPPGITSVTLTPPEPKANEDVTVRIQTDATVSSVDVVIKKDGQVVDTRAATKRGSGVFELLLNPGEGDYSLDVTAKDDAGNVQLDEGVVAFSAEPASPFNVPGLGLVGAVSALVAVALLRRRRA